MSESYWAERVPGGAEVVAKGWEDESYPLTAEKLGDVMERVARLRPVADFLDEWGQQAFNCAEALLMQLESITPLPDEEGLERVVMAILERNHVVRLPVSSQGNRAFLRGIVRDIKEALTRQAMPPWCFACGVKMLPAGSCYVCNSCGATSGCS